MSRYGQYSLIRITPDPSRGEFINAGVMLWDPQTKRTDIRYDVSRLSQLAASREDVAFFRQWLDGTQRRLKQINLEDSWTPDSSWFVSLTRASTPNVGFSEPGAVYIEDEFEASLGELFDCLVRVEKRIQTRGETVQTYRSRLKRYLRNRPNLQEQLVLDHKVEGPLGLINVEVLVHNKQAMVKLENLDVDDPQSKLFQFAEEVRISQQSLKVNFDRTILIVRPPEAGYGKVVDFLKSVGRVAPVYESQQVDRVLEDELLPMLAQ